MTQKTDSPATEQVAEIVTFRLLPGTDPQAFIKAAEATGPLLRETGGVIRRTLSVDDSGLWTDHIIWTSMEVAKSAAETVTQQPEFAPFANMIAPDDVTMRHAPVRLQMQ